MNIELLKAILLTAIVGSIISVSMAINTANRLFIEHKDEHLAINERLRDYQGYFNAISMLMEKEAKDRGYEQQISAREKGYPRHKK